MHDAPATAPVLLQPAVDAAQWATAQRVAWLLAGQPVALLPAPDCRSWKTHPHRAALLAEVFAHLWHGLHLPRSQRDLGWSESWNYLLAAYPPQANLRKLADAVLHGVDAALGPAGPSASTRYWERFVYYHTAEKPFAQGALLN